MNCSRFSLCSFSPHYPLWQRGSSTPFFYLMIPPNTHTQIPLLFLFAATQPFLQMTAPEVNWKGSCSQNPSSWCCFAFAPAGSVSWGLWGSVLFSSNLDKICSLSALSPAAWHSVYFCKTQSWIDFNKYRGQRVREPSELVTTCNLAGAPAQSRDSVLTQHMSEHTMENCMSWESAGVVADSAVQEKLLFKRNRIQSARYN